MQRFGERVRDAISVKGPVCLGIDPSPALLAAWALSDSPEGLRSFSLRCVELVADDVAAVKPQVAFFERHGSAGLAAFEAVVAAATAAGVLVVADAKRGDIGSTSEAYADAWFHGPFAADAMTVAPYVGTGALVPFVAATRASGRGLFVLASTSNPEGRWLQESVGADGRSVERRVLDDVAAWNAQERGGADAPRSPLPACGSVGAVIGVEGDPLDVHDLGGPILAPGLGAQGGSVDDVARRFVHCAPGTVLVSVSRGLLGAGPTDLRTAARRLCGELAGALG